MPQLKVKKTGSLIRVSQGTWDSLRNKGKGHLYEVVDAVKQPLMQQVPTGDSTREAYSELPEAQEEQPKPKKKRKKKTEIEINDLTSKDEDVDTDK